MANRSYGLLLQLLLMFITAVKIDSDAEVMGSLPPLALWEDDMGAVELNDSRALDDLMDFAISTIMHRYISLHGYQIPLDNVTVGSGRLSLSGGRAGDLRAAFRAAPVRVRRVEAQPPALLVDFAAGLHQLSFRYHWKVLSGLYRPSGVVQGSQSPVAVGGRLLLRFPCSLHLMGLEPLPPGPLHLNGTGFWPLDRVVYGLARSAVQTTLHRAVANATAHVRRHVAQELARISCPELTIGTGRR